MKTVAITTVFTYGRGCAHEGGRPAAWDGAGNGALWPDSPALPQPAANVRQNTR